VSSRPSSAARLPFLILVGAIMVTGLVGVLLLHMLAAQDSFRATHLQTRLATLTDAEQRLDSQVEADSAPAALEQRAKALGMVPARIAKFHKLHDGRTIGQQAPVYPPPTPVVTPSSKPTHKNAASKKAAGKHAAAKAGANKPGTANKPGAATHTSTSGTTATHHQATQHPAGHKHSPTHAGKPRTTPHHHATQG
jgi:hypothetical protein